jgi:hypothetical protein
VKDKLKDDKYLIESHSDKVLPSITSAKKILDLMEEEKSLITKFPKVGKYLNNIELIVTTFTLCLSLYSRLSYNSLIVKVGQDLIYQI